jgi:hypothetical protein
LTEKIVWSVSTWKFHLLLVNNSSKYTV